MLARFNPGCAYEPTNLDDLSIDPTDLEAMARVYSTLSDYARDKAMAMRYRASGAMGTVSALERSCQESYERLPDWARW